MFCFVLRGAALPYVDMIIHEKMEDVKLRNPARKSKQRAFGQQGTYQLEFDGDAHHLYLVQWACTPGAKLHNDNFILQNDPWPMLTMHACPYHDLKK